MFALLAMAGDLGGVFGPSLVGTVTQQAGDSLKSGVLAGSIFLLILIFALALLARQGNKGSREQHSLTHDPGQAL